MSVVHELSIAKDFSRFPAGRYSGDGPFPGEGFRPVLAKALREHGAVVVQLDGTMGYGSSFLEEAFGGLVRREGFTREDLRKRLTIKASDESLVREVWGYIDGAQAELVT